MNKDVRIGIRLDAETHNICKKLAPEGNISMWIRSLIRKELEKVDKNVLVMFDNGGGVSVDLNGWKHYYQTGLDAARDYAVYVQEGTTDGWDGHEEDCEVKSGRCSKGGLKTLTHEAISILVKNPPDYYWGENEREFINALRQVINLF